MPRDPRIIRLMSEGAAAAVLVEIAGGAFEMGSIVRKDEQPLRTVNVRSFAAALTPVTNLEFAQFLEATGHPPTRFWDDERFSEPTAPAIGISWFDALALLRVALHGARARLSPADRGRAGVRRSRNVEGSRYPWGDEPWDSGVHAFGSQGGDRPHPIGTSPPNGYGLYHMADNVHEWCSDWYATDAYALEAGDEPRGPADGVRRASRGGSWRHRIKVSRIAARSSLGPDRQYNDYGMRVYADALDG